MGCRLSIGKAQAIAKTLRWHHVGFAFLWATTFAALLYPSSVMPGDVLAFKLCNLLFVIVAILSLTLCVKWRKREIVDPRSALLAGLLLSVGSILFYVGLYGEQPVTLLVALAGICIGGASGLFYAQWQVFFTSEGASRTAIYIPLSAVVSAVLCLVLRVLPLAGIVICAIAVLPLLAALSLWKALKEIEPSEADAKSQPDRAGLLRDLWKPIFCVCSIAFVWKIVSGLFEDAASSTLLIVLAGFGAAALIIALIELFSVKGFEVLRSYQILFPLITGAFLLPTLFGMGFAPFLSGTLMFGFEIVNLLLIITCAIYANERAIPSIYVYALCMCPTFAAMIAGDLLGAHLSSAFAYDLSFVVGILFLCVYVLSLTMFLVSWTKRRKFDQGGSLGSRNAQGDGGESSSAEQSFLASEGDISFGALGQRAASQDAILDEIAAPDFLSQREREVTALIVRGNSVAAIAKKLFISENTVRGHFKSIYRKLGVHSKQQLIDLFEHEHPE